MWVTHFRLQSITSYTAVLQWFAVLHACTDLKPVQNLVLCCVTCLHTALLFTVVVSHHSL